MPHVSPITCVDHHGARQLTITGGYDGRVIAWRNGRELWATAFDDLINDVRLGDSGAEVAVAAADGHAYVLDTGTGAETAVLGPHGDDVNVVRWLPRGRGLVCTMDHVDPTAQLWERAADGTWAGRTLARHGSGVFGAAVSPDGTRVATAAEDRTGRIWNLATGEQLHVLHHPGDPETIDWSPDGTLVATGCDDDLCRLWDPDTGSLVRTLGDATAAVRLVRFSPDGTRLLVGAYDATLRSYDTTTWAVADTYVLPIQWERAAAFTAGGLVVGSFGAAPVFHPPLGPAPVPPTRGINGLAVTADGGLLVAGDDGKVLDVLAGRELTRHASIVNTVAPSPDGATVASGDYRGVLRLTDRASGSCRPVVVGRGGPINSAVWNTDGSVVYTAGYDGHIRAWSATGEALDGWRAHHSPIKSLAWSTAHGGLVVAGSADGTLSAWQVDRPAPGGGAEGDGSHRHVEAWRAERPDQVLVNSVAVADGAGLVVSASRDLHLRRWDVATGELVERLPRVHRKSVKAVAVSPDGNRIVSGAYDGLAVAWQRRAAPGPDAGEAATWAWRVLRLHGKPGVPAVALTPANLFTAGWDGTVGRWSVDGELVARYEFGPS